MPFHFSWSTELEGYCWLIPGDDAVYISGIRGVGFEIENRIWILWMQLFSIKKWARKSNPVNCPGKVITKDKVGNVSLEIIRKQA